MTDFLGGDLAQAGSRIIDNHLNTKIPLYNLFHIKYTSQLYLVPRCLISF